MEFILKVSNSSSRNQTEVEIVNDFNLSSRFHSQLELIHIIEGNMMMSVNEKKFSAQAGDIIICGYKQIHHSEILSESINSNSLKLDYSSVESLFNGRRLNISLFNHEKAQELGMKDGDFDQICHCFQMIASESAGRLSGWETQCENYLNLLVNLLIRGLPMEEDNILGQPIDSPVKTMQHAIEYIEKNYSSNISLKQLASYLYISPFYLSRLFPKFSGYTFKAYLNHVRLSKAKEMLTKSNDSIYAIASRCGFNNVRTFNRAFKQYIGLSPSQYMKKHLQK